jgi:WhiB family transcriptional regulator, redox-sensing transcriptional regulator
MATDPKSQGSVATAFGASVFQSPQPGPDQKKKDSPPDQEAGEEDMSALTVPRQSLPELPCHLGDPDLWFAETPAGLERAKTLCASCPIRRQCLAAALERAEPWGVWGGEIFERGSIVSYKRPRGRPRKGLSPAAA